PRDRHPADAAAARRRGGAADRRPAGAAQARGAGPGGAPVCVHVHAAQHGRRADVRSRVARPVAACGRVLRVVREDLEPEERGAAKRGADPVLPQARRALWRGVRARHQRRRPVPSVVRRGRHGAAVEPGHVHQRRVLQGPQSPCVGRGLCAAGLLLCHRVARPHRAPVELRPHPRAARLRRPPGRRQLRALPPQRQVRRHGVGRQVGAAVGRPARLVRARLHRPHRVRRRRCRVARRPHHGVGGRGPDRQRLGPGLRPPHALADRPHGPHLLARLQPGGHAAALGVGRRDRPRLGRQALERRQRPPPHRPAPAQRNGRRCNGCRRRSQKARRRPQEARRRRHLEGESHARERRSPQNMADQEHAGLQHHDHQAQPRRGHRRIYAV
ncbi:hypothetical protein GGF44_001385, partial [Coemansia sp. RSA 1694]